MDNINQTIIMALSMNDIHKLDHIHIQGNMRSA